MLCDRRAESTVSGARTCRLTIPVLPPRSNRRPVGLNLERVLSFYPIIFWPVRGDGAHPLPPRSTGSTTICARRHRLFDKATVCELRHVTRARAERRAAAAILANIDITPLEPVLRTRANTLLYLRRASRPLQRQPLWFGGTQEARTAIAAWFIR